MKKLIFIVFAFVLFAQPVSAEVTTTKRAEGYPSYMYVAGEAECYPFEYYDEEKEAYMGVIPDMLCKISQLSGVDFVYINGDLTPKDNLSHNLQADIVSCEIVPPGDGADFVELFSYESGGKTKKYGIAFTRVAPDDSIALIKSAAQKITAEEKTGIYLSYAKKTSALPFLWIACAIVLFLILAGALFFLVFRIKKIRRQGDIDRMTDSETGMGNLQFFKYHFRYTIDDMSRSLYHLAYIIIDSSYLRSYYGDKSFGEVLEHTAAILSHYSGDREIPARITENGFVFAFMAANSSDAKERLEEILRRLREFEAADEKNSKPIFHAATYHLASTDRNCELLLFNLRKNCIRILGTDKQIVFCDVSSMNKVQEEKKITESILSAFENNEFKMYLQFIVDNKTKKIVSAEALSRWDSLENGLITPNKYIDNMERAGLIGRHDFYMFDLACRQLQSWKDTEYKDLSISCNFTRITLSEENFVSRLLAIVNGYSFDRSKLSIEITEDAIEKDRETATSNVRKCKELGFRIYLDDLGSGYTSLANLCDYPIDVVKIDRDILLKADTKKGRALFGGIIALAHSLGIKVVCEGVETQSQNELVSQSDCDFIQGWYYFKPLPLEEYEPFIQSHNQKY